MEQKGPKSSGTAARTLDERQQLTSRDSYMDDGLYEVRAESDSEEKGSPSSGKADTSELATVLQNDDYDVLPSDSDPNDSPPPEENTAVDEAYEDKR